MTYADFKDALFKAAKQKGFKDFELYYAQGSGFSVRVFDGEIAEYKNSVSEGVGFRGTMGDKMGYAYSERLGADLIEPMLANAAGNAEIIEEAEGEELYAGCDAYPECNSYDPALQTTDAKAKIQMAMDMESHVKSLDARIKMADYCQVGNSETNIAISNSYGLDLSHKMNAGYGYVLARAEDAGVMKSGMELWRGRNFADFDYKQVAKKAVDIAIANLGAGPVKSGTYTVVLDNITAASLLDVFCAVFFAEAGQKGFSLLNKSRLGETIAAPCVTICDDAILPISTKNRPFDAEGVSCKNKRVIDGGVLSELLYTTKSAKKDGVKSTGNASKPGFSGAITTGVNNFYIAPGSLGFDEVVAKVGSGVLITDLAGLHSGTNTVSGDFSVSADGFVIEDGKITRPIDQITLAGNFFQLLKQITIVGSDLRAGFMEKTFSPCIAVDGLQIAGL